MSVLIGEMIVCGQRTGGEVQLRIFGDEFYARYETVDGYTVVFDKDYGGYCYALLAAGRFVSSGVPIGKPLPAGLRKHLKEAPEVRNEKFAQNYSLFRAPEIDPDSSGTRTLGPDGGLLDGRKLNQGTVRGLTILVDFDDVTTAISREAVYEMFNETGYTANGNYCSVNEYFKIISSGKLNYVNMVVGPVKLSKPRSYYISNLLVREALDIAVNRFNVDLADFDSRGEGIVDAINILYAGNSQYNGQLWPHNSVAGYRYGSVRTHYYQLTGLGMHPVDLRIGTICHENGHLLCRFPDMYDYGKRDGDSEKSQGIGCYCLMGSGNHLNDRRTPSPVCSYLRQLAGWVDTVVLLDSPGKFIAGHGAYDTVWKYETTIPNEYFMVENRSRIGLDAYLPASGLAVYHCDTLGSNEWQSGTRNNHYQCALLQADGSLDLENNRNAGDATDLFSEVSGVALSDATTPSSRMWNGTDSGLMLSEIDGAGQDMSFTVGEPRDQPVVELETSPNLLIPDNNPDGVTSVLSVGSFGELVDISVDVEIIHSWISDLKVTLVAPDGTEVVLHNHQGADGDDISTVYTAATAPELTNLNGGEVQGVWSLVVIDTASQDVGRLVHWGLVIGYQKSSSTVTESARPNMVIPDADPQGIVSGIQVQQNQTLKNITVAVNIEHTYIGDLRVDLVSPGGQVVRLHDQTGGSADNLKRSYDTTSTPGLDDCTGLSMQGEWQLQVRDLARLDTGTLVDWSLNLEY
ncbi:MAG: M6 family metalloprotease domain-containing protein [Desulfobulbaceae bacterium]|nr:M6 family metalloprotease domain-containing protein [Desulfobulbaceae bacterium]